MRGSYEGGAYTFSNTSVKEKVSSSAEGPISGGGGEAYRRRNTLPEVLKFDTS